MTNTVWFNFNNHLFHATLFKLCILSNSVFGMSCDTLLK